MGGIFARIPGLPSTDGVPQTLRNPMEKKWRKGRVRAGSNLSKRQFCRIARSEKQCPSGILLAPLNFDSFVRDPWESTVREKRKRRTRAWRSMVFPKRNRSGPLMGLPLFFLFSFSKGIIFCSANSNRLKWGSMTWDSTGFCLEVPRWYFWRFSSSTIIYDDFRLMPFDSVRNELLTRICNNYSVNGNTL